MDTWAYYDPKGKGKISVWDILFFIVELQPPFGNLGHLKIPIRDGMDFVDLMDDSPPRDDPIGSPRRGDTAQVQLGRVTVKPPEAQPQVLPGLEALHLDFTGFRV